MKADSKSEFDNLIGFSGEDELAGIDALLNNASDDATARVDFVSIKRRAIKQAKRKKQKRCGSLYDAVLWHGRSSFIQSWTQR